MTTTMDCPNGLCPVGPTVHNPTNFEPSDYEVVDYLDNRRPEYFGQDVDQWAEDIKYWEAEMAAVLGPDWRAKSHRCVHCGNGNVRWITAVRHLPTDEIVVFGSDCTARLGFVNKVAFKLAQLQAKAEAGHAKMKIWKQREAFLAATPAIVTAIAQAKDPVHAKNHFVQDVLAKLNQFGSLSERQVNAVVASLAKDIEFAARRANEAVEVKGDAPSGRQTVTGLVLSTKQVESQYGWTTKMLVKLANNSKVWLTAPSKHTIERGDTITVTATFEVSRDDKSFGFGKRPHLVSRTAAAPATN